MNSCMDSRSAPFRLCEARLHAAVGCDASPHLVAVRASSNECTVLQRTVMRSPCAFVIRHSFCALAVVFVTLVGCVGVCRVAAQPHAAASELEGRLFAPCCYIQTLDVHESALASELRTEIARRLEVGEASQQIEDDLVRRYGARVRAVPRGIDPRGQIPLVVGAAMLAGVAGLLLLGLRWMRRSRTISTVHDKPCVSDAYDARLDAELRNLDG